MDFASACKYITDDERRSLILMKEEVGKLLGDMIKNPGKYT